VCERVDARDAIARLPPHAVVVGNLPFGERLGGDAHKRLQLEGFYRTLGERLRGLADARVLLFSAHPNARELLNLDAAARTRRDWALYSGALPARLFRWDLP
jgi:23S rRNA G2445 N2-methylase RlmL